MVSRIAKSRGQAIRAAAVAVAVWVLPGCLIGVHHDSASSDDDPRCEPYCQARVDKGCGGDKSLCLYGCSLGYSITPSQGKCEQAAVAVEDCRDNPAILELGCSPPYSKLDEYCKAENDALAACVKERDGT